MLQILKLLKDYSQSKIEYLKTLIAVTLTPAENLRH